MTFYPLGAQLEGPLGNRKKWTVPKRVYFFALQWAKCELAPEVYTLPSRAYDDIAALNILHGRENYQLVIGIKTTPDFYSSNPGSINAPVKLSEVPALCAFVQYVDSTLHPDGFEFGNEPEFPEGMKNPELMGGYGPEGGNLYGQTVLRLHDYMTLTMPETRLLAGASYGLLNTDNSLKFLREAVEAGMQADYWSWHCYIYYYTLILYNPKRYYDILWFADEAYKVFPVPQVLSETSLLRRDKPELAAHRAEQARMLEFELRYRSGTAIESVWWYTIGENGWEHSDLVWQKVPQPVYEVWKGN